MSDNWEVVVLENFAIIEMGQSPSGETCNQDGVGIPLLNGPTEFGSYHPKPVQFTTDPRKFAFPNDILFCVRGSTTGRMNWADQKYAIGRGIAAIRHRFGSEYRYFLKAIIDFRLPELLASATGSTFPNVSREQLANLQCEIPPLPEQRAIAGILGALDDKIELNRRMNRTLESMARAVFRHWFVESEEVASWKVGKLGDICEFAYGKGLKEDERQAGSIPVYGSNGQIGWHNEYLVKGPGIVVGRKGNPGIVTWVQNDFFPIDTTFYVVPKAKEVSFYWLYYALLSLNLPDLGADSAVPGLNRNIAYMSDVPYPPNELMQKFESFAKLLFDKMDVNEKESRTLAALRDALLPKLMRGEVRVRPPQPVAPTNNQNK